MRSVAASTLVLLAACGAWLVLVGRDAHDADGEGIERTVGAPASEDLVTLRGRSGAEASAAAAEDVPATDGTDVETATEPARTVLRGTLRGFDPTRAGVAEVRALPVRSGWTDAKWKPVQGVVDANGAFELDVTDLMAYPGNLTHIEVRVDHPAYVQGRARAEVAGVRAAGRGALSVEITLHLGLAVTGEVRTAGGDPIRGADVAIFQGASTPTGENAPIRELPAAAMRTDAEGRYRLRIPTHGIYRVVAVADEHLPAGTIVTLPPGGTTLVPPLVLQRGVSLAGRVLFREAWVPHVWIEAMPAGHENLVPMEVGQHPVAWTSEGPLPTTTWVQSDAEGRFRAAGLAPGPHTLDPSHMRAEDLPYITGPASAALAREVLAPADDVRLEIGGVVLEVRVVGGERPVADAEVEISAGGTGLFVRSDAAGMARFLVVPSAPCTVRARKEEFRDGERELTAGAAGTTAVCTVDLQPAPPTPKLYVTFTGDHVEALTQARFSLVDLTDPGRDSTDRHLRDEGRTGTYRIPDVTSGRYRLTARPGGAMWGAFGYFLPEVRDVVLPAEGEVRLEMPLRLGGRLRIAARDEAGALLEATCVIRDASGEDLDVRFNAQTDMMATTNIGQLGELSPSVVGPPLPAGTYTVELSIEGHASQTLAVEVKAGETTNVDVKLVPR